MKTFCFALSLVATLAAGLTEASGEVMISEFMALNNTTLADEDGTYSDWIELYNSGPNAVNLGGWYLTANSNNLTKWQFPSTNIAPRQFLVVFASDKDRKNPGLPLHTDFKLGGAGEFLALVMPDGITKASEFAPVYPQQYPDISYGYVMTGAVTTLVAPDAAARGFVPASDIGNSWQLTSFNDASWIPGTLGMGFDTSGSYGPAIGLNLQTAMLNVNASAYLRVPFAANDPAVFNLLTLGLRYDDGFVAYLNGDEVLRRNAPTAPAWNSSATAPHGAPSLGMLNENFEGGSDNFTLSEFGLPQGPTVESPDPNSTGQFLRLLSDGLNGCANSISFRQTAPGLFEKIVADFDFRITSAANNPADGFCFLLIPTSLYSTNGPGVNTATQAAEEPNYPGAFAIGFDVYPHNQRNDVSAHWNGSEAVNVTIPVSTLDLAAGVFHHAKVTLEHVAGGARVTLTLTPNINGSPGIPVSPITNFFIGGLNAFDCRVQFGARTGGLNLGLDLDNCNVQFIPPQSALEFEDFDISPFLGSLESGSNVLAIHGMNISASHSNFLIQPALSGRVLAIAGPPAYLYPATPGEWNSSAGSGLLPSPVSFTPAAGVYRSNALVVTLTTSSSSATIRYTLDGSTPGPGSPIYTNTILISTNATLRARSELNNLPGVVTAANYILLDSSVTNFNSNLPLIIIDTLGQNIPDGSKIGAYAIFIDTNTPTARTTLNSSNDYVGRLGIELHGSSSLGFPKKTFSIELNDEGGKALDYPLLGLPAGSDWLLYPSYDDKTLMNNVLTHELFGAMGHYAIRCKYAELFVRTSAGKLTANNYHGIYVLMERIRVEPNRLDIATLDPTDNAPPDVTGGYLFAKDKTNATDFIFYTGLGNQLILLDPKADRVTQPQFAYLNGYLNAFEAALYGPNWLDPVNGYNAFIDADSFVDFHWMVEFPKNIDGVRISNYMHKDRNGKLTAGPIWDWDLSWGNADYAEGGKTNGWYYPLMSDPDDLWLRKLRTDPDFYQKIIDRWGALRLSVFNPANILARVDQITNQLWEAQAREFVAWPRLGTYVWPNPNGAAGGWDVDYVNPTTYAGIIEQFKRFIQGRYQWIERQFVPSPILLTNGNSLTLSASLGAIHYTLDGTDPRASGGGISTSARLYAGAVTLTNNAGIVARALHTNAWSAPARAVYVATLPSLRITEINYHPVNPPTNSPYNDEDFEFVELQNTGTNVIDLAGARLAGGINFTFAPNELVQVGAATSNNFNGGGTPLTASTLGQPPGGALINDGGPSGILLRLLNSGTNTARNRVAFNQTASGYYDRLVADFDFRATNSAPAAASGTPTRQNFDIAGTAYTLSQNGPTAPVVRPGDAGSTGNYLRLVPAVGGEGGAIAFNRTATAAFNSVVTTFDFRITPPSEGNQADGMSFALLNTTSYGNSGVAPVFGEGPNLANSIGVSFDDYNNASTPAEPNNNHISLHWNGAQVGNGVTPSFDMSNGKFHRAQIIVWFFGGNAYVTVRLTSDINGTPGPTETVLQSALLSGVAPYQSRLAFSARTGGAWAAHDLDNVNAEFTANAAASAGLSLLILPAAQFGTAGVGSTLTTFADFPRVTNAMALDLAFNPSNLVNDVSLYWNASMVAGFSIPATLDLDSGMFHHARLQLDSGNGGVYATITLTPNSLGTPGLPVNVLSNWFIPGAVLGNSRLEFAGRNGGLITRMDIENTLANFQALSPMLLNPGESIVVVRNLAAFISRYSNLIRVAGEYSGSLNNAGDRLVLLGPVGEPILDFTYDPAWYPITDGGGYSLVVVDPYAPVNQWQFPQNWRPSGQTGGSPGVVDAVFPVALEVALASGGNALSLAWPANATGFELYSATALAPPVQWVRLTNAPVLSNDQWIVILSGLTNESSFYRLQK